MYKEKHVMDWDEHLPFVLFAYRTSEQESTKNSPFFLTYGREANFPLTASVEEIGALPSSEEYAEGFLL